MCPVHNGVARWTVIVSGRKRAWGLDNPHEYDPALLQQLLSPFGINESFVFSHNLDRNLVVAVLVSRNR